MKKFTKIVATVSDERCEVEFVRELHKAGMNVVRMNTAHFSYEGMKRIVTNVRTVSDKIALLCDTKGPEIRTTAVDAPLELVAGEKCIIKGTPDQKSTKECICVSYPNFVNDLSVDSMVLFDDGEIALKVVAKSKDQLDCVVQNNGTLGGKKSVNVPGVRINLPSLTEKDKGFIRASAEMGVDFIAHSFVRNRQDVADVQQVLDECGSKAQIIAKIENQEGVENIDEILEVVYGVMVARGDLGIEVAQEKIPGLQRQLIRKCVEAKKPVIVATQMLHSMIKNPRPTRAEVTDVANAIYYRTDAIMLSGETAYGKYPVEAVATMASIAKEVEASKDNRNDIPVGIKELDRTAHLADGAVRASKTMPIKAIITDSFSGKTARYLAAFRGVNPVFALCYNHEVARLLSLSYGVFPKVMEQEEGITKNDVVKRTLAKLQKYDNLQDGDLIAYLGGSFGVGGGTSYLEILTVSELLKKIEAQPLR